jgi:hypothetical protein
MCLHFSSFWFEGENQQTTRDEDVKFGLVVDNKHLYRSGIKYYLCQQL